MTTTLTRDTFAGGRLFGAGARPSADATLDDAISGAWASLAVTRGAACPVCTGELVPRYGSGPHPVAGTCRSCGTELS